MRFVVVRKISHTTHLHNKDDVSFITVFHAGRKLTEMPDAAFGGRVREQNRTVFLQRHALDLTKDSARSRFHIKIEA
jgi:hypothetical protein